MKCVLRNELNHIIFRVDQGIISRSQAYIVLGFDAKPVDYELRPTYKTRDIWAEKLTVE